MDRTELMQTLESHMHFSVALHARRYLFIHAGVVEWRGRAIVIPGRSLAGKSSLVAALVEAGATYFSDEYAVFDERGRVHPYPKALSLRAEANEGKRLIDLGGPCGSRPTRVGLILLTAYAPGMRWHPRVRSPGEATLGLFENAVRARVRPQAVLDVLPKVTLGSVVLKGKRGEAREMAASVLERARLSR